ncbi:hypothetical protein ABT147_36300 [Streptomyces sp. NPDC001868]|uniref:hypothetical protein n=1 Tax=Streptomyces sp. NPDC001868 TaxID=3154401 RepID=UPI00331FF85E
MDHLTLLTLFAQVRRNNAAFRGIRAAGSWERARGGPATLRLLRMAVQHSQVEAHLLGSLEVIAHQAPYQRGVLLSLAEDAKAMRADRQLAADDADAILADIKETEAELAALERRAAAGAEGDVVPAAVRQQALEVLQPEVSALFRTVSMRRFVNCVKTAGREGNPTMHEALDRVFAGGPFGNGAWVQRLAYYLATARPGLSRVHLVQQHLQEMLMVSNGAYRNLIHKQSLLVRAHGMEPVELLSGGWLFNATGPAGRVEFRDGGMLGVLRRGSGLEVAGEAAWPVAAEGKQAYALAEATSEKTRTAARASQHYDRPGSAVEQQVGARARLAKAVEEGQFFVTPGGEVFRLRPMPTGMSTQVLGRPHLLPEEYQEYKQYLEYLADVRKGSDELIEVVTPFDSRQLAGYANPLIRRLEKMF